MRIRSVFVSFLFGFAFGFFIVQMETFKYFVIDFFVRVANLRNVRPWIM